MSEFLSVDQIIALHDMQIRLFGGSPGIASMDLLESAVGQPPMHIFGQLIHSNIIAQAGAYLFHLGNDHCFVDGNKRTAANACLVFLDANGHQDLPDPDALLALTVRMIEERMDKGELIEELWFLCMPEPTPEDVDFDFWRNMDFDDFNSSKNLWGIRFASEIQLALAKFGFIGLGHQDERSCIMFDSRGMFTLNQLLYVGSDLDTLNWVADSLGIRAEFDALGDRRGDFNNVDFAVELRKVFVRCGIFKLAFRDENAYLGWDDKQKKFKVNHLEIFPMSVQMRRQLSDLYGIDLKFESLV